MEDQGEYEYQRAAKNHYDRHSRHFPIEDCNQPECKKAVKNRGKK